MWRGQPESDEATVRGWIERKAVPMGVHANRLAELIAVVEEMALNIQPDGIPEWLGSEVPALGGDGAGGRDRLRRLSACDGHRAVAVGRRLHLTDGRRSDLGARGGHLGQTKPPRPAW